MSKKNFQIYKSHGGLEKFSNQKLYSSLRRSGLRPKQCQLITDKVSREIGEGSKTRDIYRKTLRLVNQSSPVAAVHYSLKKAIFDLGPTGHHFETFVARYFEEIGYTTKTCQTLNGLLVKHEVDIVGIKNGKRVFVECKFHNRIGIKNDIKTALYVKARWDDLKQGIEGKKLDAFYLASNTAFTLDAITYANGTGLKLLGVNAPVEKPFLEEIKALQLYPITSLKGLNRHFRNELLSRNILLAKDLPDQMNLLLKMGMEERVIDQLLQEITLLKESKV
jgi:hypothetical protein